MLLQLTFDPGVRLVPKQEIRCAVLACHEIEFQILVVQSGTRLEANMCYGGLEQLMDGYVDKHGHRDGIGRSARKINL